MGSSFQLVWAYDKLIKPKAIMKMKINFFMTLGFKIVDEKKEAVVIKVGRMTKGSPNFRHL